MTTYQTIRENILGSALSGTNGSANRTHTLTQLSTSIQSATINIIVNNASLIYTTDYTYANGIITFVNPIWDIQVIQIQYDIAVTTTTTSTNDTKYTSILKLMQFLNLAKPIPNRDNSGNPVKETIGTGDASTTVFYFDYGNVIRNTETLYYGASESTAASTLTRTTHYNVDYDLGKITLNATAVALLSTASIYGEYSYNNSGDNIKFSDSLLYSSLVRAEQTIDTGVNTVFYDGTEATPDFVQVLDEVHEGRGYNDRVYQLDKYPINNKTTTLNGAVTAGDGTITVTSTNGFPSTGYFAVETNKIAYTGKTPTTFTGCTGATAHDDASIVTSFVIEVATDAEGNEPTYAVQEYTVDYDIDFVGGFIKLNTDETYNSSYDNSVPPYSVWNRMRVSYQYGYDEIYPDIVKTTHLLAGTELFQGQVLNAISRGTDGFKTGSVVSIKDEVDKVLNKYKCWYTSDTKP